MPDQAFQENTTHTRSKFYYGWVIVAVGIIMMAFTYGLMYSYSVFFKPLADYFNWDRATVSLVYSVSLIIRGAFSVGIGWLADRFGSRKLMVFCGFMIGLGLALSSQIQELWQFFVTYALIEAIGLSGTFGIATAVTSRWFTKNRGLALGLVSSGVGIGTLLIVPGNERLIAAAGWSQAFLITGIISGIIIIATAFLLRPAPEAAPINIKSGTHSGKNPGEPSQPDLTLWQAIRNPRVIIMITVFACIFFCAQIVIVHLVNYATDVGISPLVAATFVSIVGLISIAGRLTMGTGSDKLGIFNTLLICCVLLVISLVCLIFTRSIWSFYIFAAIFGFAYGGEVPLIPLLVGKFCGTKAMATLVGLTLFIGNFGGALGPWVAGKIFDVTASYHWAIIIGIFVALISVALALLLKRQSREEI
jgi:MFS family permease